MGIKKAYAGAVLFYLIALLLYVSYDYTQQRSALIARIDTRLILCATVADQLLPPSLHTLGMKVDTLSPEQDLHNRLVLSKYAHSMGVKYVYSIILQDEKIYFTSSSATPEELKTGEGISYYYDIYDDASPLLLKALSTRTIQFDEYTDKWGHFRSIFMPHISRDGRVYVTGVDIEISNIENQLHALMLHTFGEALFYILILAPFFIAYRFQNRIVQQELTQQVKERTFDLEERSKAVTRLLDNANQGFLSFGASLSVESEYSHTCVEIFEQRIEGMRIGELLYPEDNAKREFLEQTLVAVMEENEPIKTESILSLLQNDFIIHHKAVHVAYKLIDSYRFMLILTDITDKKNLEKNIERERNILKFVVSAISNSDEFFELTGEYKAFLTHRSTFVDRDQTPQQNMSKLYRTVHTYKGLFAQKDFITTPQGLHKVESKLSSLIEENTVSNEVLSGFFDKIDFEGWLAKDIAIIAKTLGEEFLEKRSFISIDEKTYAQLRIKIKAIIEEESDCIQEWIELLEMVEKLKYKPIIAYFESYLKYSEQIAERLEKSLYPMSIICESDLIVGEGFKPFARSFIHVIRNGIDHGIESPEERVAAGKDEEGRISLFIRETDENIEIEITDDGRGIDSVKLKERAIEAGLKTPDECARMSDEEVYALVFEDYLSTKDEVNDLSGRGVGLCAVRAEVQKLGGTCHVFSSAGIGTRLIFTLPKNKLREGV